MNHLEILLTSSIAGVTTVLHLACPLPAREDPVNTFTVRTIEMDGSKLPSSRITR